MFQLSNAALDLVNLLLDNALLPLKGKRYLLELRVPNDDRVVISGGDAGAEFLAVGLLEVLFGRYQQLCAGVEVQEFLCPLEGQVVGHHKKGFLAQPQPLWPTGGSGGWAPQKGISGTAPAALPP